MPPVGSKDPDARYVHLTEGDEVPTDDPTAESNRRPRPTVGAAADTPTSGRGLLEPLFW